MSIKNAILQMLSISKPARPAGLPPLKFFRDAAYFGEHGRIVVSSVKYGLQAHSVALVFVGKVEAPELDLNTVQYIWNQAMEQGFVPHYIEQYGQNNEIRLESLAGAIAQPRVVSSTDAVATEPSGDDIHEIPAVFRNSSRVAHAAS